MLKKLVAIKESSELSSYWESHLHNWEKSSISQSEYCRSNDLNYSVFHYWKRKLSKFRIISSSAKLVQSEYFSQDPFPGHLFVFSNRRRTILKILYWDLNGFCLWHKRLEKEKFPWPGSEEEIKEINSHGKCHPPLCGRA